MLLFMMVDRNKVMNPKNVVFAQFAVEVRRKLVC